MIVLEMQPKLIALNRLLEELDIERNIETLDDQKRVQKAVYLAQRLGAKLSYGYGWYKLGPYSPALTRDYYDLVNAVRMGQQPPAAAQPVKDPALFARLKAMFAVPKDVRINEESWLELLASADYLRKVAKFDDAAIRAEMSAKKPALEPYLETAQKVLERNGFN